MSGELACCIQVSRLPHLDKAIYDEGSWARRPNREGVAQPVRRKELFDAVQPLLNLAHGAPWVDIDTRGAPIWEGQTPGRAALWVPLMSGRTHLQVAAELPCSRAMTHRGRKLQ